MTFADNYLTLTHAPSGFELTFRAMPSLAEIRVGEGWDAEGGGVKVKYAEEWGKTRCVFDGSDGQTRRVANDDDACPSPSLFGVTGRPRLRHSRLRRPFRPSPSSLLTGHTPPSTPALSHRRPLRPPLPTTCLPGGQRGLTRSSRSICSAGRIRFSFTMRSRCLRASSTIMGPRSSPSAL